MKKWLLTIAVIVIITLTCIYIFIPSTISILNITTAKATRDGTYRTISNINGWRRWWNYGLPGKNIYENNTTFKYNDFTYRLIKAGNNSVLMTISNKQKKFNAKINILQFNTDSIGITLQCDLSSTNNPVKKIKQYYNAINIKKDFTTMLNCLKKFVDKDENIYGIKILEVKVKDTFLITTKQIFSREPTVDNVYDLVHNLQKYAEKNNCYQVDAPMLNILSEGDSSRVMVALPINKELDAQSPVSFIKMTNGNFMFTRVKGGMKTVQNALHQMQLYFDDYNKTSMAITFQYLVTNRLTEADTTKWITEIYAPVL